MKIKFFLYFLLVFFVGCKTDKDIENEKFIATIEEIGLNNFRNIEYIPTDKVEKYNYFRGDSLITRWEYNIVSKHFEKYDENIIKKYNSDPLAFMNNLRDKIKSIHVVLITQSQWPGQVFNFWTSDTEYFTYVRSGFKFDSSYKVLLENELKNSEKINDNWYYKRMIVCRNK